jgi:hypothetical protein
MDPGFNIELSNNVTDSAIRAVDVGGQRTFDFPTIQDPFPHQDAVQ